MIQNNYHILFSCLDKIEPLLSTPSLTLESQTVLIENVRQMCLILVDEVHHFSYHKEETLRLNKTLLGYVLSIPRLEEDSQLDMLSRALHQIECINVAALDIQSYLKKYFSELKEFITKNA